MKMENQLNDNLLKEIKETLERIEFQNKEVFNKKELCEFLGVSFVTLSTNGWFEKIPHVMISSNTFAYLKEDVMKIFKEERIKDGSVYK